MGFRFAAAGGPRMLTPADFTMTFSAETGASSKVILACSPGLVSGVGEVRLVNSGGASGVAGSESQGVSIGE